MNSGFGAPTASNPSTKSYAVPFISTEIETMVTSQASSVQSWIQSIRSIHDGTPTGTPTVVGLGCEWKPNNDFWITNKVATLHLCIDEKCLIIQLFHMDRIPQALKSFLEDINYTFVGSKVVEDIAKLRADYGIGSGNCRDLRPLCSSNVGKSTLGFKDYAWEILRFRMEKRLHVIRSNWEVRELSLDQIEYACIDAYVSYKLVSRLMPYVFHEAIWLLQGD